MFGEIVRTIVEYSSAVLPWFLLGAAVAYLVERRFSHKDVTRLLGKKGPFRVLASFAAGMISPLSIMPQLPVSGALVRLGADPALLLGFLAAERSYDFQSFPIIASFFGIRFAALNAAAIFVSLVVGVLAIRGSVVSFRNGEIKESGNGFWKRYAKLLAIVVLGITVAAVARSAIPEDAFRAAAHSDLGGLATGIVSGFALYFGTILGNYPVARAFSDLGMSQTGVFAFLTVSPLLNAVVLALFASAARWKDVARFFGAYAASAVVLSLVIGTLVL